MSPSELTIRQLQVLHTLTPVDVGQVSSLLLFSASASCSETFVFGMMDLVEYLISCPAQFC
jgi:hypothetical protein